LTLTIGKKVPLCLLQVINKINWENAPVKEETAEMEFLDNNLTKDSSP
jgi:hypothetical protein